MVSEQLIYFHLVISKELLIYLDHLRISRSPAKKTLGVPIPHDFQKTCKPHWGEVGCPRDQETHGAFEEELTRGLFFLWPNLVQASPGLLLLWRQDMPQGVLPQCLFIP